MSQNTEAQSAREQTTRSRQGAQPDRTQSAAQNLFFGSILEENLFPYPEISTRDREMLRAVTDAIDQFLGDKQHEFKTFDRSGEQPAEYIQALRDMGLFGLIIPEAFGGLELSNAGYARVLTQTSSHDSSTSLTVGAHSSIGMKGLLLFGSDEQKARYLPRLATGDMIAAFCLTEAGAGSDAASIKTSARLQADGSWLLNGEKIWITNGGIADFYTVFARTDSAEGKMTAFMVEAKWPGVSHGPHEDKMGIRASNTCTVAFTDVRVPAENVLGMPGKGFKVAMGILNNGRTGLGGGAVGTMKTLLKLATHQASERKQFGRSIAEFGLVRKKLAQIAIDCFAAESAVWMVAHYIDSGVEDYSMEAAISKVFASEAVQRAAHEATQIAAGNGFMREFPYEQITRDTRILSIFEGTNEILRMYVALSGLKDVGESLAEIKSAVGEIFSNPIKGFGLLTGYAGRRFSQATGWGSDRIVSKLHPRLKATASIYEKATASFAASCDQLLRMHGRKITERQYDLERIGDVAIDLFVGLCTLSRADAMTRANHGEAEQALRMAKVFALQSRRRIAKALRALEHNEDGDVDAIAGRVLEQRAYAFDVF
jgi:alkylation response protein AidB-like acyl-CoA dehydrogenase